MEEDKYVEIMFVESLFNPFKIRGGFIPDRFILLNILRRCEYFREILNPYQHRINVNAHKNNPSCSICINNSVVYIPNIVEIGNHKRITYRILIPFNKKIFLRYYTRLSEARERDYDLNLELDILLIDYHVSTYVAYGDIVINPCYNIYLGGDLNKYLDTIQDDISYRRDYDSDTKLKILKMKLKAHALKHRHATLKLACVIFLLDHLVPYEK